MRRGVARRAESRDVCADAPVEFRLARLVARVAAAFDAPLEQSFAGTVMGFFMTLGLFLGSLLSFVVAAM